MPIPANTKSRQIAAQINAVNPTINPAAPSVPFERPGELSPRTGDGRNQDPAPVLVWRGRLPFTDTRMCKSPPTSGIILRGLKYYAAIMPKSRSWLNFPMKPVF